METLILQIGLKHGRNSEIHRLDDGEFYLGRAYSNDIIVTDPYVAPKQLRLYCVRDVGWFINTLDTTNPVLLNGHTIESPSVAIAAGDQITIGRTQLRLCAQDHAVEPTRKLLISSRLNKLARGAAIPVMLFFTVGLLESLLGYWFANIDGDWKGHALNTVTGMGLILVWAGGWAVVGRLLRHQTLLGHHLVISCLTAALGILQFPLEAAAEFFSNSVPLRTIVSYLLSALLLTFLLRYNLHFATNLRRTGLIAATFSFGLMAMLALFTWTEKEEQHYTAEYSSTLLPPVLNPLPAKSLDAYLQDMGKTFQAAKDN